MPLPEPGNANITHPVAKQATSLTLSLRRIKPSFQTEGFLFLS